MPAVDSGIVAVTGANGFIGSHVVDKLLEAGYTVRAVVRAPIGNKADHLKALPNASLLSIVEGDLLTPGGYDTAFAGAAAVVHTAAVVEILDTKDAERRIVRPSVEGALNAAASARKAGINRLVHLSSVAAVQSAYGKDAEHTFTEADWNTWSTVASDAYGFAKTQAEKQLWSSLEAEAASFDLVSLCPGVVLGPCMTKAHTKSSAVLMREVVYNNPMQEYNATFVDVRDVARASVAALRLPSPPATAPPARFLLVNDEPPMKTTELAARAAPLFPQYRLAGTAKYGPWTLWLLARLRMVSPFQEAMATRTYPFSNARLKDAAAGLGISPLSLDETVRDTVQSMVSNDWVKPKNKL